MLLSIWYVAVSAAQSHTQSVGSSNTPEETTTQVAVNRGDKTPGSKATEKAEKRLKKPGVKATEKVDDRAKKQAGKQQPKHRNFKGTIRAVDGLSISLELKDGSIVNINLNDETRIKMPGQKEAELDVLKVGLTCLVQAFGDDEEGLTARKVLVIPGKPTRVHRVGLVTAYSPGVSITIQARDGMTYTFNLSEDVKILPSERTGELGVGSKVTIIAPRNASITTPSATGIVIHPAGPGVGNKPIQEVP